MSPWKTRFFLLAFVALMLVKMAYTQGRINARAECRDLAAALSNDLSRKTP